ncbi:capsule biosynthesis protein CapI [Niastella vici]|uniref:Capsule biosynthesis protein CapI n=1 Tax=Niastella vici TaxID=1703345 RepID=A0A1V9FH82_9BACT|nr:NAD-dependent epimerase [Niastella vici]OQP57739.1 capsule biosynthesis protein CapI [Niastella vici]
MKILVTGSAGFIGYFLTKKLLERGDDVTGIDNINEYYDVNLKYARLADNGIDRTSIAWNKPVKSRRYNNYRFIKLNLEDKREIITLFKKEKFDLVAHLAAQAGVRYSMSNPDVYIQSNITGFLNVLEACRQNNILHLVYASSSSVYGLNEQMPFSVTQCTNHPVSLYAATKKSNELMAHVYSHLFNIPTTGLRFFTVYGPWGRPDMACFLFADAIMKGQPITVYNQGKMKRDFTYIDDIVEGIVHVLDKPAAPAFAWNGLSPDPSCSSAPYRIYNIGNDNPVELMDFIREIEMNCGKKAKIEMKDLERSDVLTTWADINDLATNFDYRPTTPVQTGLRQFIAWYRQFYAVEQVEIDHLNKAY